MKDPIIFIDEDYPIINMKAMVKKIMSKQQTIRVYKIKEDQLDRVCYARIIMQGLGGSWALADQELSVSWA